MNQVDVKQTVRQKQNTDSFYIRELVKSSDSILHTPSVPITRFEDPVPICKILSASIQSHGGFGLSACQIGINKRAFALWPNRDEEPTVFLNPEVIEVSPEKIKAEEGCLSYPGILLDIDRPIWVNLKWNTVRKDFLGNYESLEMKFWGLTARAIFHEMDHLNGTTILNLVGPVERRLAIQKAEKLLKRIKRNGNKSN